MTSLEERFNAAVNVIQGLPKNGSYQPSNDMKLRFYSYYKQATLGPCTQRKPPFWDVVGKVKWDSWTALGDLPRERAMEYYVEELKKIIETMSYTDNVANFMGSINELDGINVDDLEVVAPDAIKQVRSRPNSPFASREASPTRVQFVQQNGAVSSNSINQNKPFETNHSYLLQNGHTTIEQSDDEYIDTVEENVEIPTYRKSRLHANHSSRSENSYELPPQSQMINPVLQQILLTVQRMSTDCQAITQRFNTLEKHVLEIRTAQVAQKLKQPQKYPKWWPFDGISPQWFIFLIVWPFLVKRIGKTLQRRK